MASILPQPGSDPDFQMQSNKQAGRDLPERFTANEKEMWRILDVVSRCIRADNDFKGCLNSILQAAIQITLAGCGTLFLWNRDTRILKLVLHYGLDPSCAERLDSLHEEEAALYGITTPSGEQIIVEDIALADSVKAPGLLAALLAAGIRAFESTPLVTSSGNVVGAVSTYFSTPHQPSSRELPFLDVLAHEAGDYIERVQLEQGAVSRSDQLEELIRNAPLGTCLVDSTLNVRHANPAALRIFGAPTDIVGFNFAQLMQSTWNREYADEIVRKCRRVLLTGEPCTLPEERACRIGRQEQEYHEWRIHRINLPDDAHGIACYFRDISPRVQARMKIHDQEERLRRVVRLAAAGQIASSLAHEINNPLAAITNALYLLGEHATLDQGAKDLVHSATAELARVSRIVRQSLSYYRSGAALADMDMGALVSERLSLFAERFASAGITVTPRIDPDTHTMAFAEEIRQVVDNLLLNAIEAMPGGGHISISVNKSHMWKNHAQPGVRLTVADTGCGIPSHNLQRIFDAFFTTKPEGGRGLGLWVVRGIVAKHEGSLTVRSREGTERSGTIVSIVWPETIAQYGTPQSGRHGAAA
jgi:signal transduction histidine kinase